jgi:LmbE family N-acetylglucosaminyl deacetylase
VLGGLLWARRSAVRAAATDTTDASATVSALILAPHPDDETLGCGATILRKVAAGQAVTIWVAVDGRHAQRSEDLSGEVLADIRRAEMVEAANRLGLPGHALRWGGFEDQTLSRREDVLVELIRGLLVELNPDEVYVTGVFEPHPDHAALGRAARQAMRETGVHARLMEYPIWLWSQLWHGIRIPLRTRLAAAAAAADVLLLRRPAVRVRCEEFLAAKQHALAAHASQVGRPDQVPGHKPWRSLPEPILAAAADSVELFLPWSPATAAPMLRALSPRSRRRAESDLPQGARAEAIPCRPRRSQSATG